MSLTLHQILRGVADYERVSIEQLTRRDPRPLARRSRDRAMWLARQLTDCSSGRIGQVFGRRHHATVLRAVARAERLLATQASEREQLQALLRHLDSSREARA